MKTSNQIYTLEDRLDFIQSLELATPESEIMAIGNSEGSASVDAGSLMSFVDDVKGQQRSDVLNSCLLAQLAANKKYDREKDTENWYKFYSEVLQNIGWVIQDFKFSKMTYSGASFEPSALMLLAMEALCSPSQYAVLKLAISAIRSLSTDHRASRIFEASTHSSANGNFQLGTCAQEGDQVTMALGGCFFSSTKTSISILFSNFDSAGIDAYSGTQAVTLDNDIYRRVRQAVIDKLGDNASKYVADLDI